MKLYEIKQEYDELMAQAELFASENEGVIPDDLAARIDAVSADFEEKIVNCALMVKNYEAEAAAIREEEKRLSMRRRSRENSAEWLRGYIDSLLPENAKFERPIVAISRRRSEAVNIYDEDVLPSDLWIVKREPAKAVIKKIIKEGNDVPGARIVENWNLQIR